MHWDVSCNVSSLSKLCHKYVTHVCTLHVVASLTIKHSEGLNSFPPLPGSLNLSMLCMDTVLRSTGAIGQWTRQCLALSGYRELNCSQSFNHRNYTLSW